MKTIELKPINDDQKAYDEIEKIIRDIFRKQIYLPLLKILEPNAKLMNSVEDLVAAIQEGQIVFNRGRFTGKFNSKLSRELKAIGAKWDSKTKTYRLGLAELPLELRNAVRASEAAFSAKLDKISERLKKILPDEIADQLNIEKIFDTTLWKLDRDFRASVKGISMVPELTPERRKKIADEWQNNLKLYIKKFTEEETVKLREQVQKSVFTGQRIDSVKKEIEKSFQVSANKAKFLARQETRLLSTKFKETRYTEAGVMEYKWNCVAGSKNHPVRTRHKELAQMSASGKIFRWDDPPITTSAGEPQRRNNPGQDYNCRCYARPVVRFK